MKKEVNNLINEFLDFSGEKAPEDFKRILNRVRKLTQRNEKDIEAVIKLQYVKEKLEHGLEMAEKYGEVMVVVICTEEDIEEHFESFKGKHIF